MGVRLQELQDCEFLSAFQRPNAKQLRESKHQTNAVLFYLQLPVRNAATVSESPRMKTFSVYRWVSGLFQIFLLYQYYS